MLGFVKGLMDLDAAFYGLNRGERPPPISREPLPSEMRAAEKAAEERIQVGNRTMQFRDTTTGEIFCS